MIRLLRWFFPAPPPVDLCENCEAPVTPCPDCGGDWRTASCTTCSIGRLCTACGKHWT